MKNKVLWAFSMVLFLLVSCTFLSLRIEKLMMPQATKTAPDFSNPTVAIDCLFVDENGMHLYRIGEGTGWEQGTRAYEMQPDNYHITGDAITMDYSGNYVVQYASKQPKDGEIINVLQMKGEQDDHWVVTSPVALPPTRTLFEDYTLLEQSENVMFLSTLKSAAPFMEDRARSELFGKEISFLDPNASQYAVYSVNDLETLLHQLPLLAILTVFFLFPLLVWLFSFPYITRPRKHRKILLINGGVTAAMLLAMPFLLNAIQLPSSLLPQDYIFSFSFYTQELDQAFTALSTLVETGGAEAQSVSTALFSTASSMTVVFFLILGAGVAVSVGTVLMERKTAKRRKTKVRRNRKVTAKHYRGST